MLQSALQRFFKEILFWEGGRFGEFGDLVDLKQFEGVGSGEGVFGGVAHCHDCLLEGLGWRLGSLGHKTA